MSFNYIGPLNTTGYGVASTNYLSELLKLDNTIGFKPIGDIQSSNLLDQKTLDKAITNFDYSKPTFCFWHLSHIPEQIKNCTGRKVGMTTFEIDTLNNFDTSALTLLDECATASTWGKSILEQCVPNKQIHVIPHAFKATDDTELPKYLNTDNVSTIWERVLKPIKFDKNTLFLSTAGKYESRKGHPELIDACIEIGKTTPITLIALVYNPFIYDNFPYSFINSRFMYPVHTESGVKVFSKGKFKLVMLPPTAKREELHSALSRADFFISPSKGEGWNLPLFEMSSLGMPCITTLNTAHTDYCTKDSCIEIYPDASKPIVKAYDGMFFNGIGNWANITKDTIITAINTSMKYKGNKQAINQLVEKAINNTSKFSWQQSAKIIVNLMTQN